MKNYFLGIILILCTACQRNKLDIDVTEINVDKLIVLRLEKDLFSLNESNFEKNSTEFSKKYGRFYEKYLINPLKTHGVQDVYLKDNVLRFTHDKDISTAYEEAEKIYTDDYISQLSEELNNMRKRFRYHFPKRTVPSKFITCLTGWNYAFAYTDSTLVVGLDMYLGENSKLYKMLAYPQYQVRKMNAAHLLPDVARGWLLTEFDNGEPTNTLLYHTIFYGKLYYSVKALLPHLNDSLIIGYTSAQMKYCETYEKKLWGYFAEKNRLYENNMNTVRELTGEGPFTGSIHKDCPPRIAMWVGLQIVRSYMNNNKEVSLEQLMGEENAQKILSKSKYRP